MSADVQLSPIDIVEEVKLNIRELTPEAFTNHFLLDRVPHLFVDRKRYVDWKTALAGDLAVDPYSIVVVGSSCLGCSISPGDKFFKPFHAKSDIDVAVISLFHFDEAWRWLRQPGVRDRFDSKRWHNSFDDHRGRLVFDGAIATDKILSRLPYGPHWSRALHLAANREPTVGRKVKARIYKDFEALRSYQLNNVRSAKQSILAELAE
jgi:hypothetical protein